MPQYITDCPRCGVKNTTFDMLSFAPIRRPRSGFDGEVFSVCRNCHQSTVFIMSPRTIDLEDAFSDRYSYSTSVVNEHFDLRGFIGLKDLVAARPPEHLPGDIASAFIEGATCLSVKCYNASVAMYRLCLDLATKALLPVGEVDGLNDHTRRNLGPRLKWLFDSKRLDSAFKELSHCIKDNGNDGAHDGTVGEKDALDVQDFTCALLEALYTQPKRIELAKKRREDRHATSK